MSKTYAIGDLHGRFDLLCHAIDLVEADAGEAGGTLVVLGDFVDRGPQSRNIIDLLMAGPRRPDWRWIVLQGNHEAMMLAALRDPLRHLSWWLGNGGGQTLNSYGYQSGGEIRPLKVPATHLAWLDQLPLYYEDEHRIYVHAGVPFDQLPAETRPDTLQWMIYSGGSESYLDALLVDDGDHISGKHIVHGHQQSATNPLLLSYRTNLDSYAWRTGRAAIGVFYASTAGGPTRILEAIGRPMEVSR